MASDFETFCTTVLADLVANVSGLSAAVQHSLAPWSPEELEADGARHVAVWPAGEQAESVTPLDLGALQFNQVFRVLVWEDSGTESERQVTDTTATATFLQLQNDVRARFMRLNFAVSGYYRAWPAQTRFPERSSQVRWFELSIAAATAVAFT